MSSRAPAASYVAAGLVERRTRRTGPNLGATGPDMPTDAARQASILPNAALKAVHAGVPRRHRADKNSRSVRSLSAFNAAKMQTIDRWASSRRQLFQSPHDWYTNAVSSRHWEVRGRRYEPGSGCRPPYCRGSNLPKWHYYAEAMGASGLRCWLANARSNACTVTRSLRARMVNHRCPVTIRQRNVQRTLDPLASAAQSWATTVLVWSGAVH